MHVAAKQATPPPSSSPSTANGGLRVQGLPPQRSLPSITGDGLSDELTLIESDGS